MLLGIRVNAFFESLAGERLMTVLKAHSVQSLSGLRNLSENEIEQVFSEAGVTDASERQQLLEQVRVIYHNFRSI